MGGGSGIHYSLKNLPIIHLIKILKFWVIRKNKTNCDQSIKKVAKKSDYSLFINFFFNSLKKTQGYSLFLGPQYSLFTIFLAHYSLFIIKKEPLFTNHYTPSRPSRITRGSHIIYYSLIFFIA